MKCAPIASLLFKENSLATKKITAAFSFERDKREKASKLNLPIVILLPFSPLQIRKVRMITLKTVLEYSAGIKRTHSVESVDKH